MDLIKHAGQNDLSLSVDMPSGYLDDDAKLVVIQSKQNIEFVVVHKPCGIP